MVKGGHMKNFQKPLKAKVSITLDEDVIRKVKALAEDDERNFSQYINMILKKHILEAERRPVR